MGWWSVVTSKSRQREAELSPVPLEAPSVINSATVMAMSGATIDIRVSNFGGPCYEWSEADVPAGLQVIEKNPEYCRITGSITLSLLPPVITQPAPQYHNEGDTVSLTVYSTGGAVETWDAVDLPPGLSITEQYADRCVISGIV